MWSYRIRPSSPGERKKCILFDVLFRFFREIYGDDNVKYVRNFTDIDDKINQRAKDLGKEIQVITDQTIAGTWKIWRYLATFCRMRCPELQTMWLK